MPGINRHLHEVSKDEASRLRRETAKRHAVNKYTFQSMPWPIKEDWNHIETLHPLVLELSYADGTQDAKNDWRKAMKQIQKSPEVERLIPVHSKIRLIHDVGGLSLPARTLLTSVILPSTKFLDRIDPERRLTIEELREAIREQRAEFEEMVQHPASYECENADKQFDDIIRTYESFYMLEPIEEKWGRYGIFKCSCSDFMGAACCAHSILMAMLYDDTLEFPSEESRKELARRAGNSKRPSAWAPEHEDEEQGANPKRMRLCPVNACEDMDLLPRIRN
jgi:hypothetical protein